MIKFDQNSAVIEHLGMHRGHDIVIARDRENRSFLVQCVLLDGYNAVSFSKVFGEGDYIEGAVSDVLLTSLITRVTSIIGIISLGLVAVFLSYKLMDIL